MKRQERGREKERFIRRFRKHFLLRFHMSLILSATCLSGALFSKLLLFLSVRDPLFRYPLTATLSYFLFFVFFKLWLWYVSTTGSQKVTDTANAAMEAVDVTGLTEDIVGLQPISVAETFAGGGGRFGGGGASGSFEEAGKSLGDKFGDLLPDLDEGAGFVLVVLGLLLAVIFGAGLFLIYSAPTILSEAAFEFLLAGTLIKSSKKMDDPDWMGSVLRATWVPFALVLVLSLTAGWLLHHHFPDLVKISEVFKG